MEPTVASRNRPGTDTRAVPGSGPGRRSGWLAGGGIAAALLASACCVLPLVLSTLGIGGAWIGQLTALAPYQPWFWAAGALLVAGGFGSLWRGRRACRLEAGCGPAPRQRLAHALLWLAALLLAVIALWPLLVPALIG